jgi:DNA-binding NarL/FixJ family response regulator
VAKNLKALNIEDTTPQVLRYTYIADQLAKGVSQKTIAKRLDLSVERMRIIAGALCQPEGTLLRKLPRKGRDGLLVQLLAHTGKTSTELSELKKSELDALDVPTQLREDVREYARTHSSPYVFATRQSPQLSSRRIQQIVKGQLRGYEYDTPLSLRYVYVRRKAAQGESHENIAQQLGVRTQRIHEILGGVL